MSAVAPARESISVPSAAPAEFFDAALETFSKAAVGRLIETRYSIGGKHVVARFAGPAMVPIFTPAISHLRSTPSGEPDLIVHVFDEASTQTHMPPAPWSRETFPAHGVIKGFNDDRFFTVFQEGTDILFMLDGSTGEALYWTRDHRSVPYWEVSFPMRLILHWRFRNEPLQPIHAGAVGSASGGVLIAGKSGSGKSTTTLSCLESRLLYAGDDYVLADVSSSEPHVHSLYSTAKLVPDNQHRFPRLTPFIANPDRLEQEKALIFLRDHLPEKLSVGFPLRAILLPRVTGRRDTRLVRGSAPDAYRAIAPTTLYQLPRIPEAAAKKIRALCGMLPVYVLEAGTDLEQIPRAIEDLLG